MALAQQLTELRIHARELGLFTDDRELLTCTSCGLMEDVTSEGFLITCDVESLDINDSGLRFTEQQEGKFSCPRCGANIVAGDIDSQNDSLQHDEG